jgi:hypothetical protein
MPGSSFQMAGAREILQISGGAISIERHIQALEESVESNPSLAFDLARSLVESVCKTILVDRGDDPENYGFKDLLKRTYSIVRLVPETHGSKKEIVESIQRILDGFESVIQGLTDLRHNEGMASHGKDVYAAQLEAVQARLAAQSADVVVHYLFMAHKNYETPLQAPIVKYEDNDDFNIYIDDNNVPVRIFNLTYSPSEVLFSVDEKAYLAALSEFSVSPNEDNDE